MHLVELAVERGLDQLGRVALHLLRADHGRELVVASSRASNRNPSE